MTTADVDSGSIRLRRDLGNPEPSDVSPGQEVYCDVVFRWCAKRGKLASLTHGMEGKVPT